MFYIKFIGGIMLNKLNLNAKKVFTLLAFLVSFIYFGIFRFLIIPSGDDYFWWGDEGSYLVHHMFYGPQSVYGGSSNGRYFGNLTEIITMRHLSLATLGYALGWTLLIWCLWKLSGKTITALLLSLLFVFTLQGAFINNILVWNAGFVNYVPPMVLVLFYVLILNAGRTQKFNKLMPVLTFLIALAGGLFTETMTLTAICLGIIVMLYFRKNLKLYHITYFLGTIVSAVTMFSHPGYRGQSAYRSTTFDPAQIWNNYAKVNHFWLITFNVALLIAILCAILILVLKSSFPTIKKTILAIISAAFLIYYIGINIYLKLNIPLNDSYNYNSISNGLGNLEGIVSVALIIFIGYCIFTFFKNDPNLWLYFLLTGVVAGQLLFVNTPLNCRGYFLTYIFMYLIGMKFVLAAIQDLAFTKTAFNIILLVGLVFMAGTYQAKLYANNQANLERVNHPAFYNKGVLFTKHVPYRKFVWANDLTDQQNPRYWKYYLQKH